jgi:hypothetical protein
MMNCLSFGSFFLSILVNFTLLDPDPGCQSNPDPIRIRIGNTVNKHDCIQDGGSGAGCCGSSA